MLAWFLSLFSSGIVGIFGSAIVQPILQAWLGSQNIDLEKLQQTDTSLTTISAAVLDANVKYAGIQESYNVTILNWWPFRVILFLLLILPAIHFSMIVADNSVVWFFGGLYGIFNVPVVTPPYFDIEKGMLLFFILMRPVDTAVSGAIALVGQYIRK